MSGGHEQFWRRKRRIIWIAFSILLLLLAVLFFYEPSTPEGIYYDPNVASEYAYWIFGKDGKVFLQTERTYEYAGVITKVGNEWVGNEGTNGVGREVFKPKLLGLVVYNSQLEGGHVFWFRKRFAWIIDCKEWLQQHFS
jgi:hypothetical protein